MTPLLAGTEAVAGTARAGAYARHRPEQTLLYQLVEAHYPAFVEYLARVSGHCRHMCSASLKTI